MSNTGLLETLPPIAPTIAFSKGQSQPAADTSNSTTTAILAESTNSNSNQDGNNKTLSTSTSIISTTKQIPTSIKLGNRTIHTSKAPRSWAWSPFTSSARHDNATFHHWVRSNIEYADYPYARFDVSLDPLVYTDDEYKKYLEMDSIPKELEGMWDLVTGEKKEVKKEGEEKKATSTSTTNCGELQTQLSIQNKVLPWTKSETDALLELARACDLRWPVIIDRWHTRYANSPISSLRKIEDLQHRYYEVGSILAQRRAEEVMTTEVAKLAPSTTQAADPVTQITTVAPSKPAAVASSNVKTEITTTAANVATATTTTDAQSSTATDTKQSLAPPPSTATTSDAITEPPLTSKLPPPEADALQKAHAQTALHPSMAPPLSLPATGTAHHRGTKVFDLAAERTRRAQLDRIWHRTKEEEREEEELRAELRMIETQLRKLKRSGKHLVPAGSALAAPPTAASATGAAGVPGGAAARSLKRTGAVSLTLHPPKHRGSIANHPTPPRPLPGRQIVDPFHQTYQSVSASFVDTAPVPTRGNPYLQSARLFPPSVENHTSLNKNTLKQMNAILEELSVPKEPIPTKRSCDLYDGVRKDALTLLVLQKMVLRKEGELASKKTKLLEMKAAAEKAVPDGETPPPVGEKEVADEKKERTHSKDEIAVKGSKGKKEGAAAKAKKKRPRANSTGSAGSAGKKAGDGQKKKAKKKAEVPAATAAVPSASVPASNPTAAAQPVVATVPPTATVVATVPVISSGVTKQAAPSATVATTTATSGPGKQAPKKAGRGRPRKKII